MLKNELGLISKNTTGGALDPVTLTCMIEKAIVHSTSSHFFAYTDGSTNPKTHSPNSGCGVVITDKNDKLLYSGGLIVRSDGNNFIPELAAASCVIKATPENTFLTA
jgi:hypothetical protein